MTLKDRLARQARVHENNGRVRQSQRKGRKRRNRDDAEQQSQATVMVALAASAEVELFHSPGADSEGFATLPVAGHRETWRINSKAFKRWLARLHFEAEDKAPNAQALQDALNVLAGRALFDGPETPVAVRVAGTDDRLYLDLANEHWQAVEVTAEGWRIVDDPPVRFIRPRGVLPLPRPERGGSLAELRPFVNVRSESDFALLLAWLVAAGRPRGPYPALELNGEQGSAKTTACRLLRSLIDPNTAGLRSEPKEPRDLMIAATNGWVVAFENLSHVPAWLSDALCRLATGGGFGTRELYSDDEEKLFDAMRPTMLNGINELAARSDLLDRTIAVTLPAITESDRRTERELWTDFDSVRPRLLGALLDAVSTAMQNLPSVKLERLPRMADFAEWAVAAEPCFGCEPGTFLAAYAGNRESLNEHALDSSIVAGPLLEFLEARSEWEGTATELLDRLGETAGESVARRKQWPKGAHVLSNHLRRIAPNLRRIGIDADFDRDGSAGRRRTIRLSRLEGKSSVQSVQSVQYEAEPTSQASGEASRASASGARCASNRMAIERQTAFSDASDASDASFPVFSDDTPF